MQTVTLPLAELTKATAFVKMKRAPKGAKGSIERKTILAFYEGVVIVEGPAHTTHIPCTGGWQQRVGTSAAYLHTTLSKMPDSDTVDVGFDADKKLLVLKCGNLKVTLGAEELN